MDNIMQWVCLEASARLSTKIHKLIEEADKNGTESVTIAELKALREEVVNEVLSPDGLMNRAIEKTQQQVKENLN